MAERSPDRWLVQGFVAADRAATIVTAIRIIAGGLVLLAAVAIGMALNDDTLDDTGVQIAVMVTVAWTTIATTLLLAVASGLELLRVQTEAALAATDFDEE